MVFFVSIESPTKECFIRYIREKSKNRYFKDTFTHGGSTLKIMKKSYMCEGGGAHLRIYFWHLLIT